MKTANSGLLAVEYLFVGISMVGIAIATFTQEITYAAIPLMITLLLNLFNRQQVEENILALERKFLKEQPEIKEATEDVSYANNFQTVVTQIENTQQEIEQLKQNFQHLSASFAPKEFQSKLNDVQTTLTHWQNRFNSVDFNALQQEITNLQQRLDSFSRFETEIERNRNNNETIERGLQDNQNEINKLFNLIQSLPNRSELEELKQSIDSLSYLRNEINNLVNWESFNSLSNKLNDLLEQFNHRPEPETIQNLSHQVQNISQTLSNSDFSQFGEQIKKLREQFEAIPQKDVVEALNHQEDELNKIKETLDHVESQPPIDQSPINPRVKKRILKEKPRRIRVNQRKR